MCEEWLTYNEIAKTVTNSGDVPVLEGCNGFVAINKGADIVVVNGTQLLPPPGAGLSGESYGVSGNKGELYMRQAITVQFNTNTAPQLLIIQKVYARKSLPNV